MGGREKECSFCLYIYKETRGNTQKNLRQWLLVGTGMWGLGRRQTDTGGRLYYKSFHTLGFFDYRNILTGFFFFFKQRRDIIPGHIHVDLVLVLAVLEAEGGGEMPVPLVLPDRVLHAEALGISLVEDTEQPPAEREPAALPELVLGGKVVRLLEVTPDSPSSMACSLSVNCISPLWTNKIKE